MLSYRQGKPGSRTSETSKQRAARLEFRVSKMLMVAIRSIENNKGGRRSRLLYMGEHVSGNFVSRTAAVRSAKWMLQGCNACGNTDCHVYDAMNDDVGGTVGGDAARALGGGVVRGDMSGRLVKTLPTELWLNLSTKEQEWWRVRRGSCSCLKRRKTKGSG